MSTAIQAKSGETLIVGGREFTSRLIIGTGKYRSYEEMRGAHTAFGDPLKRLAEYEAAGTRNHFHVWELNSFLELLFTLDLPVDVEAAQATGIEFAVILSKRAAA